MQYTAENLVVRPGNSTDPQVIVEVTPAIAGWEHIWFQVRRLAAGESWQHETGEMELALVPLSGVLAVESNHGTWPTVGGRAHVFAGKGHALYLPRGSVLKATAQGACEFAVAQARAEASFPAKLVTPDQVPVEIRGGDNATRQINGLLPPGFPCSRLVLVEVYTPSGSWSSYPPHKHDVHRCDAEGHVLEADLEETYYYKIDPPQGFALQRIYTDDTSPLQQAGFPIDAAVIARNNDVVLVPEGYHPVTSAPGYTSYYLNVLAGSAQSLANIDDPNHAWVKEQYRSRDPRVPLY
jgi:5-deoxy-glucuronate isomerase